LRTRSIIVYRRRKTGIQSQASARAMKQTIPPVLMSPSATRNYCCSNAAKSTTQSQSCTYICTFKVHLLCSGLNNEDERQSAPFTETLYFTPTRYAGETGTRKPPQQRMREKCLCAAPAYVHTARVAIASGAQLAAHTQPALRTGFMAPAWRLPHVSRRAVPDLT